ncbi:MAG: hypothetical protein WKF75_17120 [Singulisphaera sp.]
MELLIAGWSLARAAGCCPAAPAIDPGGREAGTPIASMAML